MRFIIIIFCILFLSGCGKDYNDIIKNNLADMRGIMYEGYDSDCCVSFVCGMREEDYKLNGVATKLIPFGIITFIANDDIVGDVNYEMIVGKDRYNGVLQKNPYEDNYMADIGKIIECERIKVSINNGNKIYNINLNRVDNGFEYGVDDVIDMIASDYKSELKAFEDKKVFKGEIYIKILGEFDKEGREKFWYVNIISPNGKSFAMVVSPYTKEVLSVQRNLSN